MNTKKAIILGTLGAILIGLVSFVATKYSKSTNRISTTYADDFAKKGRITTEMLDSGWTFEVDSIRRTGANNDLIDTDPITAPTYTEKPNTLANSTWYWKNTIDTTNYSTEITYNVNIAVNDVNYTYTSITIGPNTIKFGQTSVYNNGWIYPVYSGKTTFIDGTDIQNQNLIDFIWLNTTPINYRYYSYHQTKSETYLGIETYFASQKTYTNNSITSEGIFLCKIQSVGITTQLYLEKIVLSPFLKCYWDSNDERHGEWTNKIKFSKTNYIGNMNPSNLAEKINGYENYYNSIQNKENIYSGTWTYIPTDTNHNTNNDGVYSNETGNRALYITNAISNQGPDWTLKTTDQPINIYSQGRANYIAIYFSSEVKNYYPAPTDNPNTNFDRFDYWYYNIGWQHMMEGYGISSNPVTPPDIENGNFMSLTGMILNILTLPFTFLSQAFNLTLWADTPWAFNIKNAIFVMIGIFTFLFIIKLFTRGFDSLGEYTGSISKNKANRNQAKLNKEKAKSIKQDRKDKKE